MNVLNPTRVIKTLIASTVTVLTVALVNRDLLEMAQRVKVIPVHFIPLEIQ